MPEQLRPEPKDLGEAAATTLKFESRDEWLGIRD